MINTVALVCRLAVEPELKSTPTGVPVLSFVVACERNYKASDQERQADFIDCVAWRSNAEFISRYFHKGQMIGIEGTLQTRSYTNQQGTNIKRTEVVVSNVSFCGSKSQNKPNLDVPSFTPEQQSEWCNEDYEEIIDDDLPF